MKKLGLLVLIISMFVNVNAINVKAEEVSGLSEKLDALIMENNFTQEQFEEMDKQYLKDYDDWFWNDYLEPTKELGKMYMPTDEEEYEYCLERNRPNYKYGVLVTDANIKYAQQYSNENTLYYLLSERKQYWAVMPRRGFGISIECRNDGSRIYDMKSEIGEQYEIITLTTEAIDFIKNGAVLHEVKKTKKIEDAGIWQLKYYMYYLEKKGIEKITAQIDFPLLKETKQVILEREDREILKNVVSNIEKIVMLDKPPSLINSKICNKCAYFDLCYV